MTPSLDVPAWSWIVFGSVFGALLLIDLWVHRGERHDDQRRAVAWTVLWILTGLGFAGFVYWQFGSGASLQYLSAYLIEKSLSLDNLFVFLIVFSMLGIPHENQRTALSWGIFGALVLRGLFIFLGVAALQRFHWIEYVFGALLLAAAWKTWRQDPTETEENAAVRWLSNHIPVTEKVHGDKFIVQKDGRRVATPLLLAVLGLELTDVLFAIDSVPAAFSITREPFLVFSSNAFAILGLRSLYIVLASYLTRLHKLHYGLALILGFAAFKILTTRWLHVPAWLSLGIILAILTVTLVWSQMTAGKERNEGGAVQ